MKEKQFSPKKPKRANWDSEGELHTLYRVAYVIFPKNYMKYERYKQFASR